MKLKYFTSSFENELILKIKDNFEKYQNEDDPWVDKFCPRNKISLDCGIDAVLPKLIYPESRTDLHDAENVKKIYLNLKSLNVQQAMDGRLWSYLCHITYWKYMKKRWRAVSINQVHDRYFIRSKNSSRPLIHNGISRLWWFGHLTFDDSLDDPFELTNIMLEYQEIQAALLERSFGKIPSVRKAFLEIMKNNLKLLKTKSANPIIKDLGAFLNKIGGVSFLAFLSKETVKERLQDRINSKWA